MDLTVITPIGKSHKEYFKQCADSVQAQTVACRHIYAVDNDARGPGYIRNKLMGRVTTPYVTFLDADDWLDATFAERTLAKIKPERYVYTGWWQNEKAIKPPQKAWCEGTWHTVTCVVPTVLVRQVGGFDPHLAGMEDTDFYLKLISRGICGIRIDDPLLHYRPNGGRAAAIHKSGEIDIIRDELTKRYGGKIMGCCGGAIANTAPVGERQNGDVLAMAMWKGNRKQHGRATGRHYRRMSYPKTTWVDPLDVAASPNLWQVITSDDEDDEDDEAEGVTGVEALHNALMGLGIYREKAETKQLSPNYARVRRLAHGKNLSKPIFVKPLRHYPSYTDFWEIIMYCGYELVYQNEIDLDNPSAVYIFAAPDGIPDCTNAKAHTIFWQLEYQGDYTQQTNIHTADEMWSSDASHAKNTRAKFVLLGSHPNLRLDVKTDSAYDLTMLAYMTERRTKIKQLLMGLKWPIDHPGHDPADKHEQLEGAGLLLHVHQHDIPAMTPIRYAIAAAYALPVISENVPDKGPYADWVAWGDYAALPGMVTAALDGTMDITHLGGVLHNELCIKNTFDKCVERALR